MSQQPKFTKGPWLIGAKYEAILSENGYEIVDWPYASKMDEEEVANIRLIAAAPEMHAFIDEYLNRIKELPKSITGSFDDLTKQAKALIKKAEGGNK